MSALAPWLEDTRAWTDRVLEEALAGLAPSPPRLAEAVRYALLGPGKRLRPALVRLVASHLDGRDDEAALPAAAVECVHAYSLVHDDLPCMDDDDLRRGRPTCHKVYGEALAILAGDALLTLAFGLVAGAERRAPELARVLAAGAGHAGMVGGQALDLESADGSAGAARVVEIHARKTAALFAAASEMGAIAAGADSTTCRAAGTYGLALGRLFQATDDLLDATGDASARKPSLVAALGAGAARAETRRLGEQALAAARGLPGERGELLVELVATVLARSG